MMESRELLQGIAYVRFDWKEEEEALAWVQVRLSAGVRVFHDDDGVDHFRLFTGPNKKDIQRAVKADPFFEEFPIESLVEVKSLAAFFR